MSVKERLKEFISFKKISDRQFSLSIGASGGYVNSISKSIQPDKIHSISVNYPELNTEWLLTGIGAMLKEIPAGVASVEYISPSQIQDIGGGVPVYDIDFTCGFEFRDFQDDLIIGSINLPIIKKDAKIVRATGDSMQGVIANGDMIAVREIKSWSYFEYGRIYGIVTPEYRFMKYVKKHQKDDAMIILRSSNGSYDDIDLPKSEIKRVFLVENILHITTF